MSEMVLYHHGIKGMHWGIRRFQNKDGSLTAAGKKKLAKEDLKRHGGEYEKGQKAFDKNDAIARGDVAGALKNVDQFTNQELKDLADRKKAINDIMGLDTSKDFNKGKFMTGVKRTSDALKTIGDFTTNGITLWNNSVKISNSLFGTSLKPIGDSNKKSGVADLRKKMAEAEQAEERAKQEKIATERKQYEFDMQQEARKRK